MRSRLFVVLAVALGLLLAPQAAAALKFAPAAGSPLTLGGDPVYMSAIGDYNGDGRDDVAAVTNANALHVWLAQADGTFAPAPGSPFAENSLLGQGRTVMSADFNGDDKLDLAMGYSGFFDIYFGAGNGQFAESGDEHFQVPSTTPGNRRTADDSSFTLGDIDEDGDTDIVFGLHETGLAVMLNDGNGDLTLAAGGITYFFPLGERADFMSSYSPVLGDWDGNGKVDVAVAMGSFTSGRPVGVYIADGNGDGTVTPDGQPPLLPFNLNSLIKLDLNDDAYDDIVAAKDSVDTSKNILTLRGGSHGIAENPDPDGSVYAGGWPFRLAAVDLDNQQRSDIAVGLPYSGQIAGIRNPWDATLAPFAGSPFQVPNIAGAAAVPDSVHGGDFNGDGTPDLATDSPYNNSGQARGIAILINQPDASGPASVDFGEVAPGDSSAEPVQITNAGAAPAEPSSVPHLTGADSGQFTLGASTCAGGQLPGNDSCTQSVNFAPTTIGVKTANLVYEMANQDDVVVPLTGTAGVPELTVPAGVRNFTGTLTGNTRTETFTLESTGTAAVVIGTPAVVSNPVTGSGAFTITDDTCAGETLAVDATCELEVTFAPTSIGLKSTSVTVPSSDPAGGGIRSFDFDGQGTDPAITVTPASHEFGDVNLEDEAAGRPVKTFTVTSSGTTSVNVTTLEFEGTDAPDFELLDPPSCGTLTPTSSCEVLVRFNPTAGEPRVRSAEMIVESSARGGDATVALTGRTVATGPPEPPPPGSPELSLSLKSPGKVRAGKVLTVKTTVKNTGASAAGSLVLKAGLPMRSGKAPKAIRTGPLAPGGSVTRKIKVKVKKSAKGKKLTLTVTATAPGAAKVSAKRSVRVR